MDRHIEFDYFYGKESESHSFYRMPKLLFTDELFRNISCEAKVLYGLMLDRMSLSIKNKWLDEEGHAYIYFAIEDIEELLNCGKNKAVKLLQELDADGGIGLIEKRRQGQGKSSRIYVKNFILEEIRAEDKEDTSSSEVCFSNFRNEEKGDAEDSEVYFSNFKKFENGDSRFPKSKPLEVCFWGSNYNKENNTDYSDNKSDPIKSDQDGLDEMRDYQQLISRNIELDLLMERYPRDKEMLQGIADLMLEAVISQADYMTIASDRFPREMVRSKMLKLNAMHIEYVMDCMKSNTTKIRNIKKYLLAALFNAPATMDGYYQAEVNHDFPQYAKVR